MRRRIASDVLVQLVRVAGLAILVGGIYALVVLGIGHVPTSDEWALLVFSAAAAALSALAYTGLHGRLDALANRLVHRERGSPDELVRTFGRRAGRGLPVDELLLQL